MAKQNGKIRLIGLIVTLAVLGGGIVATWVAYGENIEDNTFAIADLETKGCEPAIQNKFNIALVQKDIETIQKSQAEIKVEQKEMRLEQQKSFKKILDRLPEQ